MEVTVNRENFETEVLKSPIPVLVDFWAEWCGPCHMIAPALSQIAQEYEGKLKVGKLNVDEQPELAQKYFVQSIPNLKLFRSGAIIEEIVGAVPKTHIAKVLSKYV